MKYSTAKSKVKNNNITVIGAAGSSIWHRCDCYVKLPPAITIQALLLTYLLTYLSANTTFYC